MIFSTTTVLSKLLVFVGAVVLFYDNVVDETYELKSTEELAFTHSALLIIPLTHPVLQNYSRNALDFGFIVPS